jgi:hypothetical protein
MSTSLVPESPTVALTTGETASTVLAAQAKAMVEARYIIAMRQPRDLDLVRQKLLKECHRPGFAEVARYKKPIGKGVEGPSIRFAEAAIRILGNIDVQTPSIYDDREKRIMRVNVIDLETNTGYSSDLAIEKTVERKFPQQGDVVLRERLNKKNEKVYLIEATEDDLLNKQNALISKALRTNGLRLLPGDILEECMDQVIVTQKKTDAEDPDAAKRKIFDGFGSIGVSVDQVKEYLGHEAETITPKELSDLRALYSAVRDEETSWREVMESVRGRDDKKADEAAAPKTGTKAQQLKAELAKSAPVPETPPAPSAAKQEPAPAAAPKLDVEEAREDLAKVYGVAPSEGDENNVKGSATFIAEIEKKHGMPLDELAKAVNFKPAKKGARAR